ncbi:hypothetical protein E2562_019811 [Oryza meyeriana var. granulata]|uniref:Pectate lyase N-terminal domain-containing protein n=1 Tax=Oryza meyeriana var. granulata TaxID=110450 RepID=A0A6G1DK81_9ORYZ|nr:hypothetical protein E2562_019811 [Oryza meyeriana var. granulata]
MDDQRLQWSKPSSFLLVAVAFLATAAVSGANIGEFDEHWQKRMEAAETAATEAYRHDPFNVTNDFNHAVIRHVTPLHTYSTYTLNGLRASSVFLLSFIHS